MAWSAEPVRSEVWFSHMYGDAAGQMDFAAVAVGMEQPEVTRHSATAATALTISFFMAYLSQALRKRSNSDITFSVLLSLTVGDSGVTV